MPTVLQIDGFRFYFYSNEGNEPAHVHVSLVWASGFHAWEINKVLRIVRENAVFFLERWNEFFTHS